MAAVGRRRFLTPAAAAFLLTIISFFYLLSPARSRPPLTLPGQEASIPSDIPIPRQIWQIFFPPPGATTLKKSTFFSVDWISMAPGYTYTLVTDSEAASIISTYYSDRPEIGATFHALANPALKSDFLRYLILAAKGGTYSDVDTKPLVPLESWLLPPSLRTSTRLVVALEYDETQDARTDQTAHEVQFCQWTISSAPGHPVLTRMVDRALADLRAAAASQGTDVAHAVFSDRDVLDTTGPVAWSENVFEVLRERDPSVKSWLDFTGLREPRYFGDIVVLPIESFRGDWRDDWGTWFNWRKGRRALVRHYYNGAWRVVKLPGQE
jgi:alpha 1,6-mannosyltransferase